MMSLRRHHRRLQAPLLSLMLLPLLAGCGEQQERSSTAGKEPSVIDHAAAPRPAESAGADIETAGDGISEPSDATFAGDRIVIRVGGVPVRVRISQTPQEKERGLMFTEQLPADEGMLFVFEYEHRPAFWMKNTPIDLDVAFIDRGGRIVDIRSMKALDEETIHRSRLPALYALEVNAGWFRQHDITVGDEVEF